MVTFDKVPYFRLNMDDFERKYEEQLQRFENASCYEEAFYELVALDHIRDEFGSLAVICEARNTMNVNDEFYKKETEFFDAVKPRYEALESKLYKALVNTPYKEELKTYMGEEPFQLAIVKEGAFSPEILEDLSEENELSSRYSELIANLKAKTEEGEVPLSKVGAHMGSKDRAERSKYAAIMEEAYAGIADELDELYDKLVKIRARIAEKLGKKSFTEVGYCRMGRTSYTREDIATFRTQVKEKLVPVANKFFEEQREKLGVETLYFYDEDIYTDGKMPEPTKNVLEDFREVYKQLSPETHVYYEELLQSEFYDLETRQGKIMGAYSNYVPTFHMPFIFETYNATTGALKTYAHETGHGFHSYTKRGEALSFAGGCGSDLAEIHSMAMEFLVWPYLDCVLPEEDIQPYKYWQIKNALAFIPYGCAADEFQETIYDNPNMTKEERLATWRRLEQEYLPWKHYETDIFWGQGRMWQRQTHIYRWPFYYIDYVLAQVCALQIHFMDEKDHDEAWKCYRNILKYSGSLGFKETITEAGLESPFKVGVIEALAKDVEDSIK